MKAVVIHAPHDLRVDDVEDQALGEHDVRVRIAAGGICGSDLHYYHNGGFGAVRIKQPMILGHEISGVAVELGSSVRGVRVGQKVAVNPSLPCRTCRYCQQGLQQHCLDMRFLGSAMRTPHVHGGFREFLVCHETQAVAIDDNVSLEEAAVAEPLAVALHAVSRAGSLVGKKVLITGSGPIGVLLTAAARRAGAAEIVVTDIVGPPLKFAEAVGADRTINVAAAPEELEPYEKDKGTFDVMFEASGSSAAVLPGIRVLRPTGILVCVGQGAEVALQMSLIVTKEIELRGAFRFNSEFETASHFIASRLIDVRPLITASVDVADARAGFDLASDRNVSMKVQLKFPATA